MRVPALRPGITDPLVQAALWTGAIGLFLYLRWLPGPDTIFNPDEYIPLAVSDAMRASGWLDPNWANAELPDYFRYDQYNFYLYMVAAHGAIVTGEAFGLEPMLSVRLLNLAAQLGVLPLLFGTVLKLTGSRYAGFAALLVFITLPMAVHDAVMARPESLLYLASAGLLYVSTLQSRKLLQLVLWGVMMAAGVGIKITFASLAPLIAGAYLIGQGFVWRKLITDAGIVIAVFVAASFILTPFMFLNPDVTLNGLDFLMNQYAGVHPPHSILHGNLAAYAWHNASFFLIASPFIILASGSGLAYGTARERFWIITLVASFAILLVYFSTRSVFFERNYAHALLPAIAAGAMGLFILSRRFTVPMSAIAFALLLLVPANLALSVQASVHHREDDLARFEARRGVTGYALIPAWQSLDNQPVPACGRFHFRDFDDGFSQVYRRNALYQGYSIDAEYRSRFVILPASTFQAYLEAGHVYISKPCAAGADQAAASPA